MCKLKLNRQCRVFLLLGGWLLAAISVPTSAWAGCEATPNSEFSVLVDATSSCAALKMDGCVTDSNGSCIIVNSSDTTESIVIQVSPSNAVGRVGTFAWQVQSSPQRLAGKEVDFAISLGATGGGTCGWSYTPGASVDSGLAFKKSNGNFQKVNGIFLCSDFEAPPPSLPILLLKKTVMLENGTCGSDDVENLAVNVDPETGTNIEYCFFVENVGLGHASNVTLFDPAIFDDEGLFIGPLNSGEKLVIPSQDVQVSTVVTIDTQGEIVNTATLAGESPDLPTADIPDSIDTATVNATLVAEMCPVNYQLAVNQLSAQTGLDFAFLGDPNDAGRRSLCVPNGASSGAPNTRRYECIDQCVTKPECLVNLNDAACSPSVCEPSGSWTTKRISGNPDTFACEPFPVTDPPYTPANDPPAYCWEIQQDLAGDCGIPDELEPQEETTLNIKKLHVNPYVWQTCYSSGGRYVCETMCYIFTSEDATACPLGSTVVN